ncbi:MAG: hypothetical protein KF768_01605 [Phycisphaeraceae bacterium]|nr:hypothetical protein [Phycisphaeraceae bacterium]
MFGLFFLICIYIVLGFLLAWIAGIVAREEITITTGVVVLLVSGFLSIAAGFGLAEIAPEAGPLVQPFINFAILALMIHLIAKLSLKHSAIIAAIYAVILLLIAFALRGCVAATA